AGLRVLPGGEGHAFHRSRETLLVPDREPTPRVLSIYGGKLTSYRAVSEQVMTRMAASLPARVAERVTWGRAWRIRFSDAGGQWPGVRASGPGSGPAAHSLRSWVATQR